MHKFFPPLFLLLLPPMEAWGHFRSFSFKSIAYGEKMSHLSQRLGAFAHILGALAIFWGHNSCELPRAADPIGVFDVKNVRFFRTLSRPESGCMKGKTFNFSVFIQLAAGVSS
jgi:hypothetical protein